MRFEPGETKTVKLVEIAGKKVIRGGNNLANGRVSEAGKKAAEHGAVAAQLALARMLWTGRTSDKDVIQAYMWFCIAIDQITLTKNSVRKAMSPAQLATAELQMREWVNKSREIDPLPRTGTSLGYESRQETLGPSVDASVIPQTGQ